ncbi:hypothetical protein [Streptomyces sp. or20]|uniref:hypothetical protein n=1 Tax=Streptomyces sp. or20 TaxID=1828016 RepID=UPI00211D3E73|nr:hypothetical protein [Streptomyces sp. or20]
MTSPEGLAYLAAYLEEDGLPPEGVLVWRTRRGEPRPLTRSVLVHFFSSEGWQSWGLGGQPLIPERMPVLIDDDFLFEDGYGPRATRMVNT